MMEKGQPGPMNLRFILLSLVLLLFLFFSEDLGGRAGSEKAALWEEQVETRQEGIE